MLEVQFLSDLVEQFLLGALHLNLHLGLVSSIL